MAVGWAGDGAVNEQIQDSINDEIKRARRNVPCGPACGCASIARKKPIKNKKPSVCTTAEVPKTVSSVKKSSRRSLFLFNCRKQPYQTAFPIFR